MLVSTTHLVEHFIKITRMRPNIIPCGIPFDILTQLDLSFSPKTHLLPG